MNPTVWFVTQLANRKISRYESDIQQLDIQIERAKGLQEPHRSRELKRLAQSKDYTELKLRRVKRSGNPF